MSGFVYAPKPIEIVAGDGPLLHDAAGDSYIDAGASFGCTPVGHCHPRVVTAIQEQASTLGFVQGSYPTPVRSSLIDRLASIAPGDCANIWLSNSGTEANEAALKFARSATGRSRIVAATRGFHGRSMGSLAVTWKPQYREAFEPLVPDVEFVPFGDEQALREAVDEDTAAVILEPIQGEGGVIVPPDSYLSAARACTEAAGAALVLDEIQTGLGRTGALWACDKQAVVPDILTTAKGLGSGLPVAATLCRDWIADAAGSHGSTFSGSPIPSAAAVATLDILLDEQLDRAAETLGAELRATLDAAGIDAKAVRGRGLLIGIDVGRGANTVAKRLALDHGVLTMPAGRSVVRLLPPLTIDSGHVTSIAEAVTAVVGTEAAA